MTRCVFCKKVHVKGAKMSFHRFPNDDLKIEWLKNMKALDWTPNKCSLLCGDHFEESCLIRHFNCTLLKEGSVPTIFKGIFKPPLSQPSSSSKWRFEQEDEPFTIYSTPIKVSKPFSLREVPVMHGPRHKVSSHLAVSKHENNTQNYQEDFNNSEYLNPLDDLDISESQKPKGSLNVQERNTQKGQDHQESLNTSESQNTLITNKTSKICRNGVIHDHVYYDSGKVDFALSVVRLERAKRLLKESRTNAKILAQKVRRLQKTVVSLKTVIRILKKKNPMKTKLIKSILFENIKNA